MLQFPNPGDNFGQRPDYSVTLIYRHITLIMSYCQVGKQLQFADDTISGSELKMQLSCDFKLFDLLVIYRLTFTINPV